jgi:hypothetical protein
MVRKRFSYLLLFWFLFFVIIYVLLLFLKVISFTLYMRKMVERKHIYVTKLLFILINFIGTEKSVRKRNLISIILVLILIGF